MRLMLAAMAIGAMSVGARAQVVHGKDTVKYPPVTTIDLTDTTIDGHRAVPHLPIALVPKHPVFPSMIRYRANFDPELQATQAKI